MALTLTEAAKFSRNMLRRGVIEEIIKDSVVLQKLPFMDVTGNAYEYMVEEALAGAAWYDPNELWSESTGSWQKRTAVLRILGGDADVDNFLKATRSDLNDLRSEVLSNKSKAVKHTFLDAFYYGSNAANPKQFDGVQKLIAGTLYSGQRVSLGSGSTPAALSVAQLEAAIDLVLDGMPDVIVMTRKMKRLLNAYIRSTGSGTGLPPNQFFQRIGEIAGVPVAIDDFITNTELLSGGAYSAKTGGTNTTSIYILRFGNQDVTGFQNGGLTVRQISKDLEQKDGERVRVKWYVSLGIVRYFSAAVIDGINTATAVVA
jgi:hypothetical protein